VTSLSSPLDRSGDVDPLPVSDESGGSKADESMTDADETKKRKRILSGDCEADENNKSDGEIASLNDGVDAFTAICEDLNCSLCNQLPDRPVTVRSLSLSRFVFCLLYLLMLVYMIVYT